MQTNMTGSASSTAYDIYRLSDIPSSTPTTGTNSLATSSSFISSLSVNSNSNLQALVHHSSQSTFQLKVSIISAEVKNIVNVLKQVSKYS